jgi:hypothetical protein
VIEILAAIGIFAGWAILVDQVGHRLGLAYVRWRIHRG